MSKEKMIIYTLIIISLFFIIYTIATEVYVKYWLDYDKNKIEQVCFNPIFYDCESVIKIKDYCHYRPYYDRLNECIKENGKN